MTQPDNPFTAPGGPTPPVPGNLPAAAPAPQYTYGAPLYDLPPLRSASGLGMASLVLACVWTAVQVMHLALAPQSAEVLRAAGEAGLSAFNSQFTGYDGVSIVLFALQVACYVVSCVWLYRSRSTARAANPSFVHERSAAWTWLGWWVPIVSYWFPYQVVRDIRRATATGPVSGIGGWWALWLVFFFAYNVAGRMGSSTTPTVTQAAADLLVPVEAVATVAMIVALVLWIRIVRDITRAQVERIAATSTTQY
ncbi:DUF4328 domain-containing protein [Promicromonospora sp. NPDC052451]|uniref:DUF4328 domain-containing protein n=1 Tax=Promicromonospora sp. NPDC052451 TaxID=3364407 RepID=UPI0037C6B900